jgi:hypothetical protein
MIRTISNDFAPSATTSHFRRPFRTLRDRFALSPTASHLQRPLRTFASRFALPATSCATQPVIFSIKPYTTFNISLIHRLTHIWLASLPILSHLWRPIFAPLASAASHLLRPIFAPLATRRGCKALFSLLKIALFGRLTI